MWNGLTERYQALPVTRDSRYRGGREHGAGLFQLHPQVSLAGGPRRAFVRHLIGPEDGLPAEAADGEERTATRLGRQKEPPSPLFPDS